MKNYLSFLYYYTFVITVGIFIWAFFFGPRPGALIFVLIFAPIAFYFSVKISRRRKNSEQAETPQEHKGPYLPPLLFLIILCTLFISAFSIYAYSYLSNLTAKNAGSFQEIEKNIKDLKALFDSLKEQRKTDELTNKEIDAIRAKLLNSESLKSTSASPAASPSDLGFVSAKSKTSKVNLYAEKSYSSKIVGTLLYDQQYLFHTKEGAWYLVVNTDGKEGWVNAQYVNIVSESAQ